MAEAKRGRFGVFNNGKGLVAVAAETAEVKLKTPRGDETLAAGTYIENEGHKDPEVIVPFVQTSL